MASIRRKRGRLRRNRQKAGQVFAVGLRGVESKKQAGEADGEYDDARRARRPVAVHARFSGCCRRHRLRHRLSGAARRRPGQSPRQESSQGQPEVGRAAAPSSVPTTRPTSSTPSGSGNMPTAPGAPAPPRHGRQRARPRPRQRRTLPGARRAHPGERLNQAGERQGEPRASCPAADQGALKPLSDAFAGFGPASPRSRCSRAAPPTARPTCSTPASARARASSRIGGSCRGPAGRLVRRDRQASGRHGAGRAQARCAHLLAVRHAPLLWPRDRHRFPRRHRLRRQDGRADLRRGRRRDQPPRTGITTTAAR